MINQPLFNFKNEAGITIAGQLQLSISGAGGEGTVSIYFR
jgi:hypothetical protein